MKTSIIRIEIHSPDDVDLAGIRQALESVLEERLRSGNAAWEIGTVLPWAMPCAPVPSDTFPKPDPDGWRVTCCDDDGSIAGAMLVGRDWD